MLQFITPNEHEKREWSRLAQSAYSAGFNRIGHRYSGAASICKGMEISLKEFDALQTGYRQWLIDGFKLPSAA